MRIDTKQMIDTYKWALKGSNDKAVWNAHETLTRALHVMNCYGALTQEQHEELLGEITTLTMERFCRG